MPTFVSLLRFTQRGIEAIKDGPARLEAAREAYRAAGAKLRDFYLVTGKYDAVVIAEAPDDETAVKLSLALSARGNVRMETCRAFGEEEYRRIVASRHTNSVYLPDVSLPDTIRASADARQVAASGDVVVLVPPSSHLRAVSTLAAPGVRSDALVVVATKGIEERTLKLMSMVLEET